MMRLICFLLLFSVVARSGDLKGKISPELGWYRSESNVSALLSRLNGSATLRHSFSLARLEMRGRLSPEWVNFKPELSAVKFSGQIALSGTFGNQTWRAYFYPRMFYYQGSGNQLVFYRTKRFGATLSSPLASAHILSHTLEYATRDWNTWPTNQTELYLIRSEIRQPLNPQTSLGLALHINRYAVRSKALNDTHMGWQIGPGISFEHQSRFLLRYSLRYYRTFSALETQTQGTLFLRFIWGAFIRPQWSAFIYVDYQHTTPVYLHLDPALRFTPLQTESWVYAKLEYDLSKQLGIYCKGGYFKDIAPDGSALHSGFQLLMGMRFGKTLF